MNLEDAEFCSVDVETTGLDINKDEIISFACIPIRSGKIIVHEAYYTLIKSEHYRIESMKYHGISEGDLEKTPSFEEVAQEIHERTSGILVGHSIEFDYGILRKHFRRIGIKFKRQTVDVAMVEGWLARRSEHAPHDLTLDSVMKKYGLKSYYRHNAFADAFFTAQIFQFELPEISRLGVNTVDELIRIAGGGTKIWRFLAL
jgi:DNA polymerase-3 subunit epsilon